MAYAVIVVSVGIWVYLLVASRLWEEGPWFKRQARRLGRFILACGRASVRYMAAAASVSKYERW